MRQKKKAPTQGAFLCHEDGAACRSDANIARAAGGSLDLIVGHRLTSHPRMNMTKLSCSGFIPSLAARYSSAASGPTYRTLGGLAIASSLASFGSGHQSGIPGSRFALTCPAPFAIGVHGNSRSALRQAGMRDTAPNAPLWSLLGHSPQSCMTILRAVIMCCPSRQPA